MQIFPPSPFYQLFLYLQHGQSHTLSCYCSSVLWRLITLEASKQGPSVHYLHLPEVLAVSFSDLWVWTWHVSSQLCGYIFEMHKERVSFSSSIYWRGSKSNSIGANQQRRGDVRGHVSRLKKSTLGFHLCFNLHQLCTPLAVSHCKSSSSYLKICRLVFIPKTKPLSHRQIPHMDMESLQPRSDVSVRSNPPWGSWELLWFCSYIQSK